MSEQSTIATLVATEVAAAGKPKTSSERVRAWIDAGKSKSYVIRTLLAEGLQVKHVNKAFEDAGVKMRYQHVRNVSLQPVKKS